MGSIGWAVCYGEHGPWIEPTVNSCRDYDCCGGEECGVSIEEAQQAIVSFYQTRADEWRALTIEEFLERQGYRAALEEKE